MNGRSVRAALIAVLSLLVVVAVAQNVVDAWNAVVRHGEAERLAILNRVVDDLLQGGQNFAFERGRTNVMLRAALPVGASDRQFIDQRRTAARSRVTDALAAAGPLAPARVERFHSRHAAIDALRAEADGALAVARDRRPADLADRWFAQASGFLDEITDLASDLGLEGRYDWAEFRALTRIKLLAFRLRNALGAESSRLASALAAARAPDGPALAEIVRLRTESALIWALLHQELGRSSTPGLDQAASTIETEMFTRLRPLQDTILTAFAGGQVSLVATGDYTRASVPALDSVARFLEAAGAETQASVGRSQAHATRALAQDLIRAGLLVILAVAAMALLVKGILNPLRRLQTRILALASGDLGVDAQAIGGWGQELTELRGALATLRDAVASRAALVEQLAQMSRFNQAILDSAGEGIMGVDKLGHAIFANRRAKQLTGWSDGELMGRDHHGLIHHTRADGTANPPETCPVRLTLADGRRRESAGELFWRQDGAPMIVDLAVAPMMDGSALVGAVIVFRDAAERLRALDAIQALNADLERSNADLEQFAYAISHDLQEPLRMVSSYMAMLERRYHDKLDADADQYIDYAVQGAKRMTAMIKGLLEYARVGTQGADPVAVDLGQAIGEARGVLGLAIAESDARIEAKGPFPEVLADPNQLASLLQNLIANAIKYRRPGAAPTITLAAAVAGRLVEVSVTDDGPGIPDDDRERVFGVFQRVGARPDVAGLGMGLAICKRIVERLGGRIRLESPPAGGCRFVFTLPRAAAGVGA